MLKTVTELTADIEALKIAVEIVTQERNDLSRMFLEKHTVDHRKIQDLKTRLEMLENAPNPQLFLGVRKLLIAWDNAKNEGHADIGAELAHLRELTR